MSGHDFSHAVKATKRSLGFSPWGRFFRPMAFFRNLVLCVDNMNASVTGREPLNGAAEPGRDLRETDVFDGTKSVRAKNRCDGGRLETAVGTFINFLKLFGPLLSNCPNGADLFLSQRLRRIFPHCPYCRT